MRKLKREMGICKSPEYDFFWGVGLGGGGRGKGGLGGRGGGEGGWDDGGLGRGGGV